MSPRAVTIVHERFTEYAGSEQVVAELAQLWPDAPIRVPIAQPERIPAHLRPRVRATWLSRLLTPGGTYAHLLPALPLAMRRLDLGAPDVVVASHHAFASQCVYATEAPVIAYVHSPARWVWDDTLRAAEPGAALLGAYAAAFRPADRRAAQRLTGVVANSTAVAGRVADWWEVPARVVHPPVETTHYTPDPDVPREDFLLMAGRLVPYKRPDLAIRAAERARLPLVVAGDGRMRAECERLAGPHTTFVGRVDDAELRSLFRRCRALVMPGVEDFGIVPVEAQACGTPVIAVAAGGALDIVVPGVTGELVPGDVDEVGSWAAALADFDAARYDAGAIRRHAEDFSVDRFHQRMREVVDDFAP